MSNNGQLLKPGQKVPQSGQYERTGPRGGKRDGTEITGVENKRLPPGSEPGERFRLVDPTKHQP